MRVIILVLILLTGFLASASGTKTTKEEYVLKWKDIAIEQMLRYKIPASITLAQGLLESSSGNSELAINANNHFGIKCHGWTGDKYYYDDDKKQECFRVYNNAEQSYLDRSEFLKGRPRYAQLFTYEVTDYVSWAKGLKAAGYATNPKYAQLLIEMIEKLNLQEYDKLASSEYSLNALKQSETPKVDLTAPNLKKPNLDELNANKELKPIQNTNETKTIKANTHEVYTKENKLKYVIAKKGDTFYQISLEFGLSLNQMYRYNDYQPRKDVLVQGDIVYLMPKKSKGSEKVKTYQEDKTLADIAQEEGIKLSALMKFNNLANVEFVIRRGIVVYLR